MDESEADFFRELEKIYFTHLAQGARKIKHRPPVWPGCIPNAIVIPDAVLLGNYLAPAGGWLWYSLMHPC